MTNPNTIIRVAAKGDGITADGRHIPFSAPLDRLSQDGGLIRGPHHVEALCRHFQECGGCSLQHIDDESYAQFVTDRVAFALQGRELVPGKIHPPQISKAKSRIRASLRATKIGNSFKLGFSGAGSHRIIDLKQCEILRPELFAVIGPLREFLRYVSRRKHDMNIDLSLTDQGPDVTIKNYEPEGLEEHEALSNFADDNGLARLSLDNGLGPETRWEPDPVSVTLGGVAVAFPHGGFLQPTHDGQQTLVAALLETIGDAKLIADLFAGLGTFALNIDRKKKVYAAEGARDAVGALKQAANMAGRQVFTEHRDLFRRPLSPEELNRFDAVILDPPRAGAKEQAMQLAQSDVPKICYVSCNPASFARDAKHICDNGYTLDQVWPVGQFLWSTHVELVSSFSKA